MSKKDDSKEKPNARRNDYELIDQAISKSFANLLGKSGKIPTIESIATEVGVDRKTVERHLKDRSFEDRFSVLRAGSDKVLMILFQRAIKSENPKFMEMWLELFEGLGAKKKDEVQNNFKFVITNKKD